MPAQISDTVLNQALEASFHGYQPYHRAIALGDIMITLRANYYGACPMSDGELRTVARKYGEARGFNLIAE